MDERMYWLAFSAFPGVGPVRFALLLSHFGSARSAWEATTKDLLKINLGESLTVKFDSFRRSFDVAGYAKKLKDKEVGFLILTDEKYPKLLKQISDPPFVLYVKGRNKSVNQKTQSIGQSVSQKNQIIRHSDISDLPKHRFTEFSESSENTDRHWDIAKAIAVVGTRKITNYGREVTQLLTKQLVLAGLTIVSGLAFGVDAAAHEAAIEAGGKTIAVLGCGVDCCNPRSNQGLYDKIINGNGVVVSEMPLGHFALKGLFPARNRIISGLSLGVLVTEGAFDSGALITASDAAAQGREVFAVPGPITSSLSKGPTELIKKGAKLVSTVEDILEELKIKSTTSITGTTSIMGRIDGTEEEKKIIQILENEPIGFDEIVRIISWPAAKVGSLLSIMEIKGMVKNTGNNVYKIV
ncbi:DNA-protecting protein DprA [Candidatus Microgenomates bacterium]|nr:DNA-protecting protein DprA [Candidatus Microgenomates bacterium]